MYGYEYFLSWPLERRGPSLNLEKDAPPGSSDFLFKKRGGGGACLLTEFSPNSSEPTFTHINIPSDEQWYEDTMLEFMEQLAE